MSANVDLILCDSVATLGKVGDQVTVKAGYAWNFLIPQNKAILLTEENRKQFEIERKEHEKRAEEQRKEAIEKAKSVKDLVVDHVVKTSSDGKLFGSVTVRDVIKLLDDKNIAISKQNIKLVGGNIHHAGEYQVELTFYADVIETVKINVISNHPEYVAESEIQVETQEVVEPAQEDEQEDQ